jgi:hypothetical protein
MPTRRGVKMSAGTAAHFNCARDILTITVEEELRPRRETTARRDDHELSECEKWLNEALAGGRVPAEELRRAGEEAGFR